MGNRLDSLYKDEIKRLNFRQVDKIVRAYQGARTPEQKSIHRQELLKAFHKYFMKYVSLLKGTIGSIESSDTRSFLALFAGDAGINAHNFVIRTCKSLNEEDIYNSLVVMFLELLDKFEFYPEVSFSRYITKYMRWSIKAWIVDISHEPLYRLPDEYNMTQRPEPEVDNSELPSLDLSWVLDTTNSLLSPLTIYERFLLYLSFKEGLGVRQISERLGRAKDTIHTHIQQALTKLRNIYKKGE